jgi:tetratricopeptide (TPR) repeat protein
MPKPCPALLSNLANTLASRFDILLDPVDLDESISLSQQAVAATSADDPERARYLSNLAGKLQERFRWTGHQADLDAAVTAAEQAVAESPTDSPARGMCLSNLGLALYRRFELTSNRADLNAAIRAGEQAVAATPPDHPVRSRYQLNLGAALRGRFALTGDQADLDAAIGHLKRSVQATPGDHPELADRLSSLGVTLLDRFHLTGRAADLDGAVDATRRGVEAGSASDPAGVAVRMNHALTLWTRYRWTRQFTDLDAAVEVLDVAVQVTPAGHPLHPAMLANLSVVLGDRFDRSRNPSDLDRAISAGRQSLDLTPHGSPDRSGRLSSLGILLRTRFPLSGQLGDIDEAVEVSRQALEITPADSTERVGVLSNLGFALRIRFESTGQAADIDEAVEVTRQAVARIPADGADRAGVLSNLGIALWTRFQHNGHDLDLQSAIACRREAAGLVTSPARTRIMAAGAWGRWSIEAGDLESAVKGYATAVELLPQAAWYGLDRTTQQEQLSEWRGLAVAAASCAISAGQPERAVGLLEQGRSVLWTQTLHLRSDLTRLAERAPDLAGRLQQLRGELDTLPVDAEHDGVLLSDRGPAIGAAGDSVVRDSAGERRQRAARQLDEVLREVRRLDGFENFLQPTPFAQLREAAAAGPVVILNTSELGSHALIVQPDSTSDVRSAEGDRADSGVTVLPLPEVTVTDAVDRANMLLGVIARDHDATRGFLERERDRHAVFDVLEWLWSTVAEPVLTRLGHVGTPATDAAWPRVWWCPTGPWVVLPVHAAGRFSRNRRIPVLPTETVHGRMISSYTPTLAALTRAREPVTADARTGVRQLAIGLPETPGLEPLLAVEQELQVVARYLPPPEDALHLSAAEATRTAVMHSLPRHPWVHFACHGAQDPVDPSMSAFVLRDGPLTVADLAQLRTGHAEFAFLSACQTAAGDTRLLDEAIHLAAAVQLLGYRHVIASLWHIRDAPAPAVADAVYSRLTSSGSPDATFAARALHDAVTKLRDDHPDQPLLWAPYSHFGP